MSEAFCITSKSRTAFTEKKHIYNSNIFYYLQENPLGHFEQSDLNCMMKSTMNEIRKYEESMESYRGVLKTKR